MRDAQKSGIRFGVILIIHCIGWILTMWEILKIGDMITGYTSNGALMLFSVSMMILIIVNLLFFGYIIDRIKEIYPIDADLDEKLSDDLHDNYIYTIEDLFEYFNDRHGSIDLNSGHDSLYISYNDVTYHVRYYIYTPLISQTNEVKQQLLKHITDIELCHTNQNK